jgi:hypothetical protein
LVGATDCAHQLLHVSTSSLALDAVVVASGTREAYVVLA